ncbi:uncharacterized protein LOC112349770 [Selaginella moellendorffii]|uniref:uncharacterized protein LOC112349770 n=1 Tax=Selaginella moellendorffii TaxID=88036 RepID=UPI000D1CF24D|nr:uncharacterized protein LOC112349770 [Selaginella moellendorffii]|eukprot:XP_024540578.1 uncharacterized protein LOC112349770 [Selaginella moellendorffii]
MTAYSPATVYSVASVEYAVYLDMTATLFFTLFFFPFFDRRRGTAFAARSHGKNPSSANPPRISRILGRILAERCACRGRAMRWSAIQLVMALALLSTRCDALVQDERISVGLIRRPVACVCADSSRAPVCGIDGHTYTSACVAACRGVEVRSRGSCIGILGRKRPRSSHS